MLSLVPTRPSYVKSVKEKLFGNNTPDDVIIEAHERLSAFSDQLTKQFSHAELRQYELYNFIIGTHIGDCSLFDLPDHQIERFILEQWEPLLKGPSTAQQVA